MKVSTRFSRIGFILAAAGSAVGLGNVWKFPYVTGENGGGAFVLIYLLTILFVGLSLFIAEVTMGCASRSDAVSAFESMSSNPNLGKKWKFAGFTLITGLIILTFYPIVIGWIFKYIIISMGTLPATVNESSTLFTNMFSNDAIGQIIFFTIAFTLTFFILSRGVKEGIEKINLVLMPLLGIILLILLAYSMTLDGFSKAMTFLFVPDFSKITPSAILEAVGQAFFTLSLGMAIIITYSASLSKETNIVRSSIIIAFMDTIIALIAGVIIFTLIFTFNAEPSQGAGLVFISLPPLFQELGVIGNISATLFFVALAFAGITSCISIVEPAVLYMTNRLNISRIKSLVLIGIVTYTLGLVALLSNIKVFASSLTFFGKNVFDILDFTSISILLPIGGILVALFVGFTVEKNRLYSYLSPYMNDTVFNLWYFSIKYITPIAVFSVLVKQLI